MKKRASSISKEFVGQWRIIEMEQWDQDFVDLVTPGHIAFNKNGTGELHFGAVDANLDWRFDGKTGRIDFSFVGFDEGDEISGRGWARIQARDLNGHIVFHLGDESAFKARRTTSRRGA